MALSINHVVVKNQTKVFSLPTVFTLTCVLKKKPLGDKVKKIFFLPM